MKIASLVHLNMPPDSGVFKKVFTQVEQWNRCGESGTLYVITRDKGVDSALAEKAVCVRYSATSVLDRFKKMQRIVSIILEEKPDIIYLRQDLYYPAYVRLGKSVPLILEINSDLNAELWDYSKRYWFYNKLTEYRLWQVCRGAVCVTNELATIKKELSRQKPCCVIANSAPLKNLVSHPALNHKLHPSLIFMGHPGQPWHGTDKILTMASYFPDWHFHLVGPGPRDLLTHLPNVICHGKLSVHQYAMLLATSDVGISTLALHRNKMNEACPLKTREYLSYGLPVITAYRDTDFPDDPDFILRLPNREKNIESELDRIHEFVYRWKGRRVPAERIRQIDMAGKERERVEFFRSVVRVSSA